MENVHTHYLDITNSFLPKMLLVVLNFRYICSGISKMSVMVKSLFKIKTNNYTVVAILDKLDLLTLNFRKADSFKESTVMLSLLIN